MSENSTNNGWFEKHVIEALERLESRTTNYAHKI